MRVVVSFNDPVVEPAAPVNPTGTFPGTPELEVLVIVRVDVVVPLGRPPVTVFTVRLLVVVEDVLLPVEVLVTRDALALVPGFTVTPPIELDNTELSSGVI